MHRWCEPEHNSSHQGDQRGKHDHLGINVDRLCLQNGCRNKRFQHTRPRKSKQQAEPAAEQGEQYAFS